MENELREKLQEHLEMLNKEHKEIRKKYRVKCKDSNCFMYDYSKKWDKEDHIKIKNIKEQKLLISRLLKITK